MNIALDDIRSKAPEGATHYDDSGEYLKLEDGVWYGLSIKGNWCKITSFNYDRANQFNLKPLN